MKRKSYLKQLTVTSIAATIIFFCWNCNKGKKTIHYKNPVIKEYLADPFILQENGFYYLYATGNAKNGRMIPVYRSKDIVNWEFVRGAVEKGKKGSWNEKHFWAPEVMKIEGKFYLYYTASPDMDGFTGNRVGVAVADNPEGPFNDIGVVVRHGSIDGNPFRDTDGTLYIYYTIEHKNKDSLIAGRIYVDRLVRPDSTEGKPILLMSSHPWQEGTCMILRDGVYYLTFSTGNWQDSTYQVHYATSDKATGPFAEQQGTILKTTAKVKGPGHHSFFTGPDGKDWIVYHGWDTAHTARYLRIDPFRIENNKISSNGPSDTWQEVIYRD
jgi:beta-xylosidase